MAEDTVSRQALQATIQNLHGLAAVHSNTTSVVSETQLGGLSVEVQIFDVVGHPNVKTVYAWSELQPGKGRKIVIVPAVGSVNSPQQAVRLELRKRNLQGRGLL